MIFDSEEKPSPSFSLENVSELIKETKNTWFQQITLEPIKL